MPDKKEQPKDVDAENELSRKVIVEDKSRKIKKKKKA